MDILSFLKQEQSRDVISILFSELERFCSDFLWNQCFLDFLSKSFWLSLDAQAQNSCRGKKLCLGTWIPLRAALLLPI